MSSLPALLQDVLQSNFDADSVTALKTVMKLVDNLIRKPGDPKVRKIRLSNPAIQQKIVQRKAKPLLEYIGFRTTTTAADGDELELLPEHESLETLQILRQQITTILTQDLQQSEIPAMPTRPNLQEFNPYQARHDDHLSKSVAGNNHALQPPKGWKSQTETKLEALQRKQKQLQAQFEKQPQECHWKAYRRNEEPAPVPASSSMADESSNISGKADAALLKEKMLQQQQALQQAQNQGFTTKAMRDLQKLQSSKVYAKTAVKCWFPDGSRVEGEVSPHTRIDQLLTLLKHQVLIPDMETVDFCLRVTPPPTTLEDSKTLQDYGLVPAAKIHVQWKQLIASNPNSGWFLQSQLFQNTALSSSLPQGVALVESEDAKQASSTNSKPTAKKAKPTAADKEANLLKRMLGGRKK